MSRVAARVTALFAAATLLGSWAALAGAQELTPRTYWPAPEGTRIAVLAYSYASGDVLFDPSVPLSGVGSDTHVGLIAYMQTIAISGRTTNFLVELPYVWGRTGGLLYEEGARSKFSGVGDPGVTLTINFLGAPSMTPVEFQRLREAPRPILGASIKVQVPTGEYDPDRLVNVGANRWAVRTQVGTILPLHAKWLLELSVGAWFFSDDEEFLPGKKEQKPLLGIPMHVVRRFSPGFWASLDLTYFAGGRQTIGGIQMEDTQQNVKVGGTVVIPLRGRHAAKLSYASGVKTNFGNDFDQLLLSYFLRW